MKAPTSKDAKEWADHFHMKRSQNHIVLAGTKEFIGKASYNLIPGFQLIDKNFVLRADSTGHNPRHDLWRYLLPMMPKLISEASQ